VLVESGEYATIREMAVAEGITGAYVGRVLRLTLLAPKIVEPFLKVVRQPASQSIRS